MKTFIIVGSSIVLLTTLFIFLFQNFLKPADPVRILSGSSDQSPSAIQTIPSPIPSPTPALPVKMKIMSIGVDAGIEQVGLDKENKMDVPKQVMNVAWYNLGPRPGSVGNSVMAGHLDRKDGGPAVFFKLGNLKPGDEIEVVAEDSKIYTYIVTRTVSYKLSEFPLQEVFGETTKSRLNLITCEGIYNRSSNLYSHRLVVYSELKGS